MGQQGRAIITVDVQTVVKALRAAYADEWLAHYNYLHVAQVVTGLNAPQIAGMLTTRAGDELAHAQLLADRILELGGTLPADWTEIPALTQGPAFTLPKKSSDLAGILKVVLAAERHAIKTYKALSDLTLHKDAVTHELAETLLADEVKDEEETENLLGE